MYYIVETKEQLKKFSTYDLSKCIVEVVINNDLWHPYLSYVSLVYVKPLKSRTGFILPISHTEAMSLPYEDVISLLERKTDEIYAFDAKKLRYYFKKTKVIKCLKTAYYLKEGTAFSESSYDTAAHRFFNNRYSNLESINTIVPISKHFEKLEDIQQILKKYISHFEQPYFSLYSDTATKVAYYIEKAGLTVNEGLFDEHFSLKVKEASFHNNQVFTNYNFFTSTGRPSNSFNGVNFAALNKENSSRKCFVPRNDYFVEFDYSSYHLKILCTLIGYQFEESDIHTHLGKFYFEKDELSTDEYSQAKQLTFRLLYTESTVEELAKIPFFSKVKEYKHSLWDFYKKNGYIESPYSKRPLKNIEGLTQILPHILQNYETERNVDILNKILYLLNGKQSKIVLYCYDSFLFDFSKKDGKSLLEDIHNLLEEGGYKTSIKYGKNYSDLKLI